RLAAAHFVRRQLGPVVVGEIETIAAGEQIAAALGDRVDHAAGEAAVFGGDAGGQDLGLIDRILDVEGVGVAEQIVVHVHAIDQERVVVGERAGNRELPGVRRVRRQAGREERDVLQRAPERQRVYFRRRHVQA